MALAATILAGGVLPRTGSLTGFGRTGIGTAPGSGLPPGLATGPVILRPPAVRASPAPGAPDALPPAPPTDAACAPDTKRPFTIRPIAAEAGTRCGSPAAVP